MSEHGSRIWSLRAEIVKTSKINMEQPFKLMEREKACTVQTLKQNPQQWWRKLESFLKDHDDYQRIISDRYVFDKVLNYS